MWILTAVSIFAVSSGILVKFISVSAFTLYSIGAFWGILFLLFVLAIRGRLVDLFKYPAKTLWLMLGVGLGISINNGLFFTALKSGLVANAVLTHYLAPLLVVLLFGPLMLKEKITKKNLLLSILGLIGLFVLVLPDLGKTLDRALILGSLSAVFFAFHTALEKKVTQTTADPLSAVVYKNTVPFIVFFPFAFRSIQDGISLNNWFWLAVFGILVLGIAFIFLFKGLRQISATDVSILSYIEPIGAIILASIFFRESVGIYTFIGGLLIVLSGIGVLKNSPTTSTKSRAQKISEAKGHSEP